MSTWLPSQSCATTLANQMSATKRRVCYPKRLGNSGQRFTRAQPFRERRAMKRFQRRKIIRPWYRTGQSLRGQKWTRFTSGTATRRYLKETLPRDVWVGSKSGDKTEHNRVNVDDDTLQRISDEVMLYAAGTSAVSDTLKAPKKACKGCDTSDCKPCIAYEEAGTRWWR